jgi:hypothetical protein
MGWLSSVWHAAAPLLTPIGLLLASLLHAKVTSTPSSAEKAAHLARLAQDAAASAYLLFPDLPAKDLVTKVVAMLSTIADVPTTDAAALERAASGAVAALKG